MDKRKITRLVRNSLLGRSKCYFLFRYYAKRKNIPKTIQRFIPNKLSNQDKEILLKDMKYAMVNYRWEFEEYFLYHFDQLSDKERKSFVVEYEKNIFCDQVNDYRYQHLLDNKWKTYQMFRDFYHREIVLIENDEKSVEKGCQFIEKNKRVLLKPLISSLGHGIRIVEATSDAKQLISSLLSEHPNGFLLEEIIVQDEIMASLHPQSVNTLRINTLLTDNDVIVFKPYLRMGKGLSVVDNAGAGGVFSMVDLKSGKTNKAVDELGHTFESHPDTGIVFADFKIPKWEEAIDLAKQLALVVPQNRYTGWDLALTSTGWCMVEGNSHAQFLFQIPEQIGFRPQLEKYKALLHC